MMTLFFRFVRFVFALKKANNNDDNARCILRGLRCGGNQEGVVPSFSPFN
jgi:hypothetical protein